MPSNTLLRKTTDHDGLFKRLLRTHYPDFIELFYPECAKIADWSASSLLDKEFLGKPARKGKGAKPSADVVVRVRNRVDNTYFVIHIEAQEQRKNLKDFPYRMFKYFVELYEQYRIPVFPVVLFSFNKPDGRQPAQFSLSCANTDILRFQYGVIRLNQLNWRDFTEIENPVAAALMAKMPIDLEERPIVKLKCLSLLRKLRLTDDKREQIGEFIDAYLPLNANEVDIFESLLRQSEPSEREGVQNMVSSWRREGLREGKTEVICRLLRKQCGNIDAEIQNQVSNLTEKRLDALADSLLDFASLDDLRNWLSKSSGK